MGESLRQEYRTVVLGEPGAGKSLLLKAEILRWVTEETDGQVPVVVNLHRCNNSGVDLRDLIVAEFEAAKIPGSASLVDRMLDTGQLRVFFDGLDEVGRDDRERVEELLREFSRRHEDCPLIVTCRTAVYDGQLSPAFGHVIRIAEFDDASMQRFLRNWNEAEAPLEVERVLAALRGSGELMRIARRPLMLTIIAYLQSGDRAEAFGTLPNSRAAFYKEAIAHLLDRDRQLGRTRAIARYHANRKLLTLQRVALTMQETPEEATDRLAIPHQRMVNTIRDLLPGFDLEPEHLTSLRDEIVERSHLLRPLDNLHSSYGFAHLTLQEFLAAQALHDAPSRLLRQYQQDPDAWREVVKLWCAVASVDCTPVVAAIFRTQTIQDRVLALECLSDATNVDTTLAEEITSHFIERVGGTEPISDQEGESITGALGSLAANNTPRGNHTLQCLCAIADTSPPEQPNAALTALAISGRHEAAEWIAEHLQQLDRRAQGRAALRHMGEVAIPQLARAAGEDHELWAVDALGAIATPAAAGELATLLWSNPSISRRAAWLLASLLRLSDIEEALRVVRLPSSATEMTTYTWLWERAEPSATLRLVTGRIGYLLDGGNLDNCVDEPPMPEDPIELHRIDHRIGIPIAALGIERYRYNQDSTIRQVAPRALGQQSQTTAMHWLRTLTDRERRIVAGNLFGDVHREVPSIYQRVSSLLQPEVEVLLLERLMGHKNAGAPVTLATWHSTQGRPPSSTSVNPVIGIWLAIATSVLLVGTATLRALTAVTAWQPSWVPEAGSSSNSLVAIASWPFLVLVPIGVALLVVRLKYTDDEAEVLDFLFIIFMIFAVPAGLFLAIELLIAWLGSWVVWSCLASIAIMSVLSALQEEHRKKYRDNPLLHMLNVASKPSADAWSGATNTLTQDGSKLAPPTAEPPT